MSRAEAGQAFGAALGRLRASHPHLLPDAPTTAPDAKSAQQALAALASGTVAAQSEAQGKPMLRCVHHLACTGGTLLTRAIAAQPNVSALSEIDPLSPMAHPHPFTPTDMVGLAKNGSRPVRPELLSEIFLAGLSPLYDDSQDQGLFLVLRDHAHGKYCYGPEVQDRPSLRAILQEHYAVRSLVTLRDPVDSYLALLHNGWIDFTPASFDEYCRRTLVFLEDHSGVDMLRYEDFVANPNAQTQRICAVLGLPYNPLFAELMPALRLSGDSGRKGARISARPRRPISEALFDEVAASANYQTLITRLGYAPLSDTPEFAATL